MVYLFLTSIPLNIPPMKLLIRAFALLVCVAVPAHASSTDAVADLYSADSLTTAGGVVDRSSRTPLIDAVEAEHFDSILGLLAYVRNGLNENAGEGPVPLLSGNPAGGFHYGRWIEEARYFDFMNVELDVAALARDRDHFLAINGLVEGVGSALLVMPSASSNSLWREDEDAFAYARGTGFAYALGGHMHVPWCLYDGSQFYRFYGSLEGHQPIFRMIEENPDFIDGYVPVLWNLLEVPYGKKGIDSLRGLEERLGDFFDAGIPTVVRLRDEGLFEGDGESREGLRMIDQERFGEDRFIGDPLAVEVLGVSDPSNVDSPFELADGYRSQYYPPIPRVSAEPSTAPLVLHLLRRADPGTLPAEPVLFRILPSLLGGAEVVGVDLATIEWDQGPESGVSWEMDEDGGLVVAVEGVEAWGIVKVRTAEEISFPRMVRNSFREQMAESEVPLMRMIRFNDKWRRPPWVDELLASPQDPLDGYSIDRISWSYDATDDTIGYAARKGWAFHGSVALMHTWMINPERSEPKSGDLLAFPPDWQGWARYPGGGPILIRAEWNFPRYGSSFASPLYREAVLQRCIDWVEMGAAGIHLDDVSGMLNRIWQYGGDFSEAFFKGFRDALVEQGFPGVTAETSLDELRQRVVREMGWVNASRRVDASPDGMDEGSKWIAVPYRATSASYPGQVWINSSPLKAGGVVRATWEVRFEAGQNSHGDFRLMDGVGSEWFAACVVRDGRLVALIDSEPLKGPGIAVPVGEWISVGMEVDFASETFRISLGDGGWNGPHPFDAEWPPELETCLFSAMADPLRSGMEVRSLSVEQGEEK